MLSITVIDNEAGKYEAIVNVNDTIVWRGNVTFYEDWKKQTLELVQAAWRAPKGKA